MTSQATRTHAGQGHLTEFVFSYHYLSLITVLKTTLAVLILAVHVYKTPVTYEIS